MTLGFLLFNQTFLKYCKALSTGKYRHYINMFYSIITFFIIIIIVIIIIIIVFLVIIIIIIIRQYCRYSTPNPSWLLPL